MKILKQGLLVLALCAASFISMSTLPYQGPITRQPYQNPTLNPNYQGSFSNLPYRTPNYTGNWRQGKKWNYRGYNNYYNYRGYPNFNYGRNVVIYPGFYYTPPSYNYYMPGVNWGPGYYRDFKSGTDFEVQQPYYYYYQY